MQPFDFDQHTRAQLFKLTLSQLEEYYQQTKSRKTSSDWNPKEVKESARKYQLENHNPPQQIINHVLQSLDQYSVHTSHPNYFGLFNPRPGFSSTIADLITATYNPQLAAWSHAPFANEVERYVIEELGKKFGYKSPSIDGTFCAGGAEANLTSIICSLNHTFTDYPHKGLTGIDHKPTIYCSSEAHHSIAKAAKVTGLGIDAVRSIPVDHHLSMDTEALATQIKNDRQNGYYPMIIIGTAGTTGAGAIDNLPALHKIAQEENLWFHVDAAYGGGVIISSKYQSCLAGIEMSDSITLDLHKWFSVPMGTSLFLTCHKQILHRSFAIKTHYMPDDGDPNLVIDPYLHSIQWSRRFIGLKIYLPLAIHGWKGYEKVIDNQIQLGITLKKMLIEKGWEILNHSPLPIICFTRKEFRTNEMNHIVDTINSSGKMWLSVYPIHGKSTGRICITNYATGITELNECIDLLSMAKNNISFL